MWINVTTVGDLLDREAEHNDAVALVFPSVRLTYPELSELSSRYARALHALGVGPGKKVGILMGNRLEFLAGFLGTAKLGAVSVPINGRFKARELRHVISHADVEVLLTASADAGTDYPALLAQVFPELADSDPEALSCEPAPLLRNIVCVGGIAPGCLTGEAFVARAEQADADAVAALQRRVRVRDIALLMYTSGTTALPKGCMHTHESIVRQGSTVAQTKFLLTSEDVFWDPLPLFHCGGLIPFLGCLSVGARYCHPGHFTPKLGLQMLEEERVTVAYPAFETIWTPLISLPECDEADLSSIRLIQNIVTPERLAQYEARMPWAAQVSSYGSTECATNLTIPRADDPYDVRMQTLGSPTEGMEIKVVDPDTGEERPPDVVGELCFRGYSRFEGYYKDPEQTAATIDEGGWFHTGDLGRIDPEGRFVYTGRLKDMLKVGGENVSALEVEDYLTRHVAIQIVQVVGVPDDRYQEVPVAFVQLKPGASLTIDELIDFCVGEIATYKIPRYLRTVEEWPMSGTKIQKYVLREWIAEELDRAGITEAPRIADRPASVA